MKTYLMIVAGIIVSICNYCLASTETGYVQFEHGRFNSGATSSGYTMFYLTGVNPSPPACAEYASGERWVINKDWPAAKMQISILLAAHTAGKKVTVRGSGDCAVWSDTETAINILPAE